MFSMSAASIIKTFARIHPDRACLDYIIDERTVSLQIPDAFNSHLRTSVSHQFQFDHVFRPDVGQNEVFDIAAKDVVNGELLCKTRSLQVINQKNFNCKTCSLEPPMLAFYIIVIKNLP